MSNNILTKFSTFINRIVDIISQGNFERVRILKEFNLVFKEAYMTGEIDRLCTVTTGPGNLKFRHAFSSFYIRSGFRITIENEEYLTEGEFYDIAKYVVESRPLVRQLMAIGYDTLIIKGKIVGIQIPLKEIASLHDYMLNGQRY